jgi:hypothetical protein
MIRWDAGQVAGGGRRVLAAGGKSRCGESRRVERDVATVWPVHPRTVIRCTSQVSGRTRGSTLLAGVTDSLNATHERDFVVSVEWIKFYVYMISHALRQCLPSAGTPLVRAETTHLMPAHNPSLYTCACPTRRMEVVLHILE